MVEKLKLRDEGIALRDLELAVGLDGDGDGQLTWDEVRGRHAAIAAYALTHLKLTAAGVRYVVTGEGNGPVNALDQALRQAIGQAYPEVAKLELIDYKVRILDQGHGTDAITRVLIETSDGASSWWTVGVGHNVVEASWEALLDAVTFGLRRHHR